MKEIYIDLMKKYTKREEKRSLGGIYNAAYTLLVIFTNVYSKMEKYTIRLNNGTFLQIYVVKRQ